MQIDSKLFSSVYHFSIDFSKVLLFLVDVVNEPNREVNMKSNIVYLDTKNDGVCKCKHCGAEIVWLKSAKTGKFYPVNFMGVAGVNKTDFHNCR